MAPMPLPSNVPGVVILRSLTSAGGPPGPPPLTPYVAVMANPRVDYTTLGMAPNPSVFGSRAPPI